MYVLRESVNVSAIMFNEVGSCVSDTPFTSCNAMQLYIITCHATDMTIHVTQYNPITHPYNDI